MHDKILSDDAKQPSTPLPQRDLSSKRKRNNSSPAIPDNSEVRKASKYATIESYFKKQTTPQEWPGPSSNDPSDWSSDYSGPVLTDNVLCKTHPLTTVINEGKNNNKNNGQPAKQLAHKYPIPDMSRDIPTDLPINLDDNTDLDSLLGPNYSTYSTNKSYSKGLKQTQRSLTNSPIVINHTQVDQVHIPSTLDDLLGPKYTTACHLTPHNSNQGANSKQPHNSNQGANSKQGNNKIPSNQKAYKLPSTNPPPISNLEDILGQSYIDACQSLQKKKTVRFTIPATTDNNNPVNKNTTDGTSQATSTNICETHTTNDFPILSLQEKLEVLPQALLPWRQARSLLSAQAKAEARATHLDQIKQAGLIPKWALGLDPIPGYLEPETEALVNLKKHHAIEIVQASRDMLLGRARTHSTTGRASLITCEILYKDNLDEWTRAKDLLAQLVGSDRAKCVTTLRSRLDSLAENQDLDDEIKTSLLEGPRTSGRRPAPLRPRNRSRSPIKTRNSSKPRQARQTGRPAANIQNRQSKSNQENRAPSTAPRNTNQSKGKSLANGKGRPKNTVLQFSRDNFNGRQKSPQSSPNVRSTNSLWNEYNAPRPKRQQSRKTFNLTSAEQALVQAFRTRDDA
jgi:hypothetical protein